MLLSVDTSTAQMGIALYDGNQVLVEMMWITRQHHTTELAPAVADLFRHVGVSIDQLGAVGIAIGPGSFTSLRVGLSLAKGIALARHLPMLGVSTLDVIAAAQPPASYPLAVVIQSGRRRVALGWYQYSGVSWQAQGAISNGGLDELLTGAETPICLAGELSAEDRDRLARNHASILLASPVLCARRPAVLAQLAWARWQVKDVDDAATLAPIYLHLAGTPIL